LPLIAAESSRLGAREMDKHGIEMMILSQPNRIEVPLWLFIALAVLAAADTIFVTWIVF